MKLVLRIILILTIALAVVGVTVAVVQVNGRSGSPPTEGQPFTQNRPADRPDGNFGGREGGEGGWYSLVKNVGIVGAITSVVVVLTLLADGVRKLLKSNNSASIS